MSSPLPAKPQTSAARVLQLDVLRGIAISLVLFRHPIAYANSPLVHWLWKPLVDRLYIFGWTGVDLFFVLSGFLIGGLLFQEIRKTGALDARRFLIRRAFKIWPAYFTLIVVAFFVQHFGAEHLSWWWSFRSIWPNLLHVQNYFGSARGFTWSLSVEEHFYLALPLLLVGLIPLAQRPIRSLPWFMMSAIGLIVAVAAFRTCYNWNKPFEFPSHFAYTHIRIDGLFFGVLLAYVHHFHPATLARVASQRVLLLVGGLALISPMFFLSDRNPLVFTLGLTALYLGYGAILVALVYTPAHEGIVGKAFASLPARGVAFVGFYSYSIYLWQQDLGRDLILHHALNKLVRLPNILIWPAMELLQFGMAIGAGVVMAKLIETPSLALRDRLFPPRGGKAGASVVVEPEIRAHIAPPEVVVMAETSA